LTPRCAWGPCHEEESWLLHSKSKAFQRKRKKRSVSSLRKKSDPQCAELKQKSRDEAKKEEAFQQRNWKMAEILRKRISRYKK